MKNTFLSRRISQQLKVGIEEQSLRASARKAKYSELNLPVCMHMLKGVSSLQ